MRTRSQGSEATWVEGGSRRAHLEPRTALTVRGQLRADGRHLWNESTLFTYILKEKKME